MKEYTKEELEDIKKYCKHHWTCECCVEVIPEWLKEGKISCKLLLHRMNLGMLFKVPMQWTKEDIETILQRQELRKFGLVK